MGATQCSGCSCNKKVDQQPRCPSRQEAENQWHLVVTDGSGPLGDPIGDLSKLPEIYAASLGHDRNGGSMLKHFAVHSADPLAPVGPLASLTARSDQSGDTTYRSGFVASSAGECFTERLDANAKKPAASGGSIAAAGAAAALASAPCSDFGSAEPSDLNLEPLSLEACDQLAPTVLENTAGNGQANGFKTEPQKIDLNHGGVAFVVDSETTYSEAACTPATSPDHKRTHFSPTIALWAHFVHRLSAMSVHRLSAMWAHDYFRYDSGGGSEHAVERLGSRQRSGDLADDQTRSGGLSSAGPGRRLSRSMSKIACSAVGHSGSMRTGPKALTKRLSRMFSHSEVNSTGLKRLPPSGNANLPADYAWLESPIRSVASNQGHTLGCVDVASGTPYTPLFFVLGACPTMIVGMQIVMFCYSAKSEVGFWWVKPRKAAASELETQTLSLHTKGAHKNDPGRSRPVYKPLADLFEQGQSHSGRSFGIEKASDSRASARAYIDQPRSDGGTIERVYLTCIWIEDWTTNPFARSKYIKGKLIYQKRDELRFHSRQYCIVSGSTPDVTIWDTEDPGFDTMLPDEKVKLLWE